MSLLGKIFGAAKSLLPAAVGAAIPGIGGVIAGSVLSAAVSGGGGGGKIPTRALPGGAGDPRRLPALTSLSNKGKLITAGAAAAGAAGQYLYDQYGHPVRRHRRRRKGITPKDLTSFKRVARLIDKFAAPVHHLRKSSFKPKHT